MRHLKNRNKLGVKTSEKVIERLDVYEKETLPLIKYYEKQKILLKIDANDDIDNTSEKIMKELY